MSLLDADTPHARRIALAAFEDLEPGEQEQLLRRLNVARIEDVRPRI